MHDIPPDWYLRRRVKLRQLALLVALAEHQGLRRAAAAMHLTQPAATRLLRELETTLGAALFERLPRGMRPTPSGEILLRHARRALAALERAREEIAAHAAGTAGSVAVGSVRAAAPSLLAPALAAMRGAHPLVRFQVLVDAPEIVIPRLREGRLDLVLGGVPTGLEGADLCVEPLLEEPLAVVARPAHPLARARSLDRQSLAGAEWIVHPQESPLRPLLESIFLGTGVRVAPAANVVETASVIATLMLLERTDMLAVVPLDVARHYGERGLLAILPIELPLTLGRFGIVTHADGVLSPAARAFADEVRRIAATSSPPPPKARTRPRRSRAAPTWSSSPRRSPG